MSRFNKKKLNAETQETPIIRIGTEGERLKTYINEYYYNYNNKGWKR